MRIRRLLPVLALLAPLPALADETDYASLSLDELLAAEVTSVAKKPQKLADASAAVFVVSAEDIRRSGAQSLPEILRMVPGIEVGQIAGNSYAVSARGFNGGTTGWVGR